jgi:toxin CptA
VNALAAFAIAFAAVGLMGYAVQRGATCTVAAVDEVLSTRRATRLLALLEASLWVALGLVLMQGLHLLPGAPAPYPVNAFTVLGGVLLGVGAWLNGACVFGAIARFGAGEWAYALTPLGFYLGCLTVGALFGDAMPKRVDALSPLFHLPWWLAGLAIAALAWRLARAAGSGRLWSPHVATSIIGITFLVALLAAGGMWAYTDVLAEIARGMSSSIAGRLLLLLALFGGALLGGWTAGRFSAHRPAAAQLLRCCAGGVLMGWGSLLIPGANDGLILVGLPLLWPYAWLAFATMCASIAAAIKLQGALRARQARRVHP